MQICHVTSALAGGPATCIHLLSSHQAKSGHEVSLVYSSVRDDIWPYRKRFDHLRTVVPWRVDRAIGPRDLAAFAELVGTLRRLAPDIVHLHCSKAGALGRLAARLLGIPAVYTPHGVSYMRTASRFSAWMFKSFEFLLASNWIPLTACSESEATYLRQLPVQIYVVPNAIDLTSLPKPSSVHQSADHTFCVGISGLIKDQRQPRLVRRIVELAPPSWRWLWIGDGAMRSVLEGLPNLEVTGWCDRSDVLRRLARVDVVLHASRWEGMPNALLEAMALGKPVVVSDVPGTRDVVTNEVDGVLIGDAHRPEPYVAALARLEADPRLRARLGEAARRRIELEHDIVTVGPKWDAIYAAAITAAPAKGRRLRTGAERSALSMPPFKMSH